MSSVIVKHEVFIRSVFGTFLRMCRPQKICGLHILKKGWGLGHLCFKLLLLTGKHTELRWGYLWNQEGSSKDAGWGWGHSWKKGFSSHSSSLTTAH